MTTLFSNQPKGWPRSRSEVQAMMDEAYQKGFCSSSFEVSEIYPANTNGHSRRNVQLTCRKCGHKKFWRIAHLKNNPKKAGCLKCRSFDEPKIRKRLEEILDSRYVIDKVYYEDVPDNRYEKSRHKTRKQWYADIYDKLQKKRNIRCYVANLLKGINPSSAKYIVPNEVKKKFEEENPGIEFIGLETRERISSRGYSNRYNVIHYYCTHCEVHGKVEYRKTQKHENRICCANRSRADEKSRIAAFIERARKKMNGQALLYTAVMYDDREYFLKVGITTDLKERAHDLNREYNLIFLSTWIGYAGEVADLEQRIKDIYGGPHSHLPTIEFAGMTECYELKLWKPLIDESDMAYWRQERQRLADKVEKRGNFKDNVPKFLKSPRHHRDIKELLRYL